MSEIDARGFPKSSETVDFHLWWAEWGDGLWLHRKLIQRFKGLDHPRRSDPSSGDDAGAIELQGVEHQDFARVGSFARERHHSTPWDTPCCRRSDGRESLDAHDRLAAAIARGSQRSCAYETPRETAEERASSGGEPQNEHPRLLRGRFVANDRRQFQKLRPRSIDLPLSFDEHHRQFTLHDYSTPCHHARRTTQPSRDVSVGVHLHRPRSD